MLELFLPLILFLLPLAYSPGPGNMFFASLGARFGFQATFRANFGYHIATLIVTVWIGFGFSWIFELSPVFCQIIRYLGSAYIFYLAWSLIGSGVFNSEDEARPAGFMSGVILLILNPKAYIIIALMFTQFLSVEAESHSGPDIERILAISLLFTVNNLLAFTIYAAIGDRLAALFRQEIAAKRLNIIFGTLLALVGVWMLFA